MQQPKATMCIEPKHSCSWARRFRQSHVCKPVGSDDILKTVLKANASNMQLQDVMVMQT